MTIEMEKEIKAYASLESPVNKIKIILERLEGSSAVRVFDFLQEQVQQLNPNPEEPSEDY